MLFKFYFFQLIQLDKVQITLGLAISLILIGFAGIITNNKNILITMLCVELVYISVIFFFLVMSNYYVDIKGQIYALSLLIIAASESAIGLGLIIVLYRFGKSINFYDYQELRG